MSATNGASAWKPILLGSLTPDRRPVQVTRGEQTVTLQAWVEGSTCPGSIKSRVSKANDRYRAAVWSDGPAGPDGEPTRVFTRNQEAWTLYLSELLMAAIEGLSYDEADALSGDEDRALDVLAELGWWEREPKPEAEAPEAEGEDSTTAKSSPASPRPTGSRRRRS